MEYLLNKAEYDAHLLAIEHSKLIIRNKVFKKEENAEIEETEKDVLNAEEYYAHLMEIEDANPSITNKVYRKEENVDFEKIEVNKHMKVKVKSEK